MRRCLRLRCANRSYGGGCENTDTAALFSKKDYNAIIAINDCMEDEMASLTVRNFDDGLKAKLRIEAAKHGLSMEEEVRQILQRALTAPKDTAPMGQRLSQRFAAAGGVELALPARDEATRSPDFTE